MNKLTIEIEQTEDGKYKATINGQSLDVEDTEIRWERTSVPVSNDGIAIPFGLQTHAPSDREWLTFVLSYKRSKNQEFTFGDFTAASSGQQGT